MIPVEGYGVDCYVRFNRLSGDNREIASDRSAKTPTSESLALSTRSRAGDERSYYYQTAPARAYHGRKNPDEI